MSLFIRGGRKFSLMLLAMEYEFLKKITKLSAEKNTLIMPNSFLLLLCDICASL